MHRAAIGVLISVLFLGLALPVAWAGGRVAGEGYALSVPQRFELLAAQDRATCAAGQLPLTESVPTVGAPDLRVFCAGRPAHPHAVIVMARIQLADQTQLRSRLDLQRYLLDHVRQSQRELETLVSNGEVTLTPTRVGELDGLLMQHDGSRGALGLIGEPAVRALVVRDEAFIFVLALLVADEAQIPIEDNWQQLVRSLVIDPRGAFLRSALLYGGVGLAALILLVFVLRLRAQRRARGPRGLPPPKMRVTSADDLATPGFQVAGAASGELEEGEPQPAGAPPPSPAHVAAPARPLTPSLGRHRAEHPDAPTAPPPAPLVAPEDDVAELPPPTAGQEHESVPHSELEKPVDAPPAPPARKGLIRTRPQGGRFGE